MVNPLVCPFLTKEERKGFFGVYLIDSLNTFLGLSLSIVLFVVKLQRRMKVFAFSKKFLDVNHFLES